MVCVEVRKRPDGNFAGKEGDYRLGVAVLPEIIFFYYGRPALVGEPTWTPLRPP